MAATQTLYRGLAAVTVDASPASASHRFWSARGFVPVAGLPSEAASAWATRHVNYHTAQIERLGQARAAEHAAIDAEATARKAAATARIQAQIDRHTAHRTALSAEFPII